jgi:hypothetical protein
MQSPPTPAQRVSKCLVVVAPKGDRASTDDAEEGIVCREQVSSIGHFGVQLPQQWRQWNAKLSLSLPYLLLSRGQILEGNALLPMPGANAFTKLPISRLIVHHGLLRGLLTSRAHLDKAREAPVL